MGKEEGEREEIDGEYKFWTRYEKQTWKSIEIKKEHCEVVTQ